ncbi:MULTISPECIES: TIGR03747 family integrating conjugative element membrane protein [unclassified Pseudomonas]|uniref:TIGR03747 family integrating conjugative element membrane protein n=1 Tax=unclassified Pseudomonas TaxID=196821 RepID=UPI000C86D27A|nr:MULTISPECIES: TIGR03747 family integrating conjugative element membrane protein [unclassified Pseudomonas]PMV25254.1 TIGR03747 family integrating conjugative element membrane protein [Pseudomonas sp. FW305-3-2-15-C-TSA2]PMV28976.1 TIGR03747 family integrating conjugative element membrane protein [Pseudomonas sp. DP16D-L5]PMV38971.1 TIGR03747 family integrating conjugative element membrane protein [Pseudomonas sp. FW305-3-2-15-A-LB2]PMV41006.1 TIGR03747 family integrating conjugative element 
MRDPANVAQQQQARQQGFVAALITLPLRFLGVLLGSLLLCLVIELVGMHLFWPEQGWRHAQGMMSFELQQLSTQFTRSVVVQEPGRSAYRLVAWLHQNLLLDSGLLDWLTRMNEQAKATDTATGFNATLAQAVVYVESYVMAAFYTTATFLLRLLVLVLSLPLFALAALTGLVDGLVRRDLRRFSAGRESGFLYHRARATILPLAVLPWVTYLTLPVSTHPAVVLLPAAGVLLFVVGLTAGSFKKHL